MLGRESFGNGHPVQRLGARIVTAPLERSPPSSLEDRNLPQSPSVNPPMARLSHSACGAPLFPAMLGLSVLAHFCAGVAMVRSHDLAPPPDDRPAATVLSGETVEVPGLEMLAPRPDEPVDLDDAPPKPSGEAPAEVPDDAVRDAPPKPRPQARPTRAVAMHGVSLPNASEHGSDAEPARFGAVGERSAVDLATAFTRGFPQAASGDPVWLKAGFGSAGSAEVVLTLDATGHLTDVEVRGTPSSALRQAIAGTVALVRARAFTAKASVTRLRIVGSVSADAIRNETRGNDVYAIGGSFSGHAGSAFFSLSVGRRIDVTITER